MKNILLICFVFLVCTCITNAQTTTLFGGLTFPQGDFGDDNVEDFFDDDGESGLAKMGFGGGFEYSAPLQSEGLSWVISASFLMNGVDEDEIKKEIDDDADVNLDFGSYYNIPIMAGLKFEPQGNPDMKFYLQATAGLNIAIIGDSEISGEVEVEYYDPNYGYQYIYVDAKQTYSFDTATSFGFGIGGGLIFNNVNIGLRYLLLGTAKFEGESEIELEYQGVTESESEDIDNDQPISILLITLGIQLN